MSKANVGGLINFFAGHPSTRLLPKEEILDASRNVLYPDDELNVKYLDKNNRHPLSYGADEGAQWVREEIAQWINRHIDSSVSTSADHINLTAGASYGVLNALLQTTLAHTNYTRQAFIVTPTYFLINDCFIDAGFAGKITAVDEGSDGQIDLNYLTEQLEHHENLFKNLLSEEQQKIESSVLLVNGESKDSKKKIYKYVIWVVPSFSNPGGHTLTNETRLQLIEIARIYDILIIADDVYDFLDYTNTLNKNSPLYKRIDILDRETLPDKNSYGNTLSNASFSKIIAPGLRVGWQTAASTKLAFQLSQGGANTSGGSPSQFNANIAGNLIKTGALDTIISKLTKVYSDRSLVLRQAVKKYLPEGTSIHGGDGGYFAWITLPPGYDCRAICKEASNKGVNLANGDYFEVSGKTNYKNWGSSSVRVSISWEEAAQIEEGVKVWGEICKQFAKK